MLLHALCKSVSHTDEEFNLKYDVYEASQIKYFRDWWKPIIDGDMVPRWQHLDH